MELPEYSEVHVWCIALDAPDVFVQAAARTLNEDELQRSRRFRFDRDRRRYTVSHAAVRTILANYLQVDGDQVTFAVQQFGKPSLAEPYAASGLHFNLSHSHELALLAVARQRAVGVDVEYLRPLPDMLEIAQRFFAPTEAQQLQGVFGTGDEVQAFYNCWTRKEAFIKAVGSGLYHPLDSFAVTLLPDDPPRFQIIPDKPDLCHGWSLLALEPSTGYCAAVVVEGDRPACVLRQFDQADLEA